MNSSKILKTLGVTLAVLLLVATVFVNGWVDNYWSNKTTTTITTTYVDAASYVEEETYFFEANYWSNDLNNGAEVFEFRMNYYTDPDQPDKTISDAILAEEDHSVYLKNMYSTGIQFYGKPQFSNSYKIEKEWNFGFLGTGLKQNVSVRRTPKGAYHYNTSGIGTDLAQSYDAVAPFTTTSQWIVDFDGPIGLIKQNGYVKNDDHYIEKDKYGGHTSYFYRVYDIFDFIEQLYYSVKGQANGYKVLQYDMSTWFSGHELVTKSDGKQVFEPNKNSDYEWMFANIKINRSANGMINKNQSMFKMVKNNASWEHELQGEILDYYKNNAVVTLTNADFDFTHIGGGRYYGSLKHDCINYLKAFKNVDINITIDLNAATLPGVFYGLTNTAFGNLEINKLQINSSVAMSFSLPYEMFFVQTSPNVTLIIGGV